MHAGALEEWSTDVTSEAVSAVLTACITCIVHGVGLPVTVIKKPHY